MKQDIEQDICVELSYLDTIFHAWSGAVSFHLEVVLVLNHVSISLPICFHYFELTSYFISLSIIQLKQIGSLIIYQITS